MVISTVLSSVFAYIGTNIDDIFLNMLFFSQSEDESRYFSVIAGKYIGTGLLTAAACLGAYGMQSVAEQYIWSLGFLPILLGLKAIKDNSKRGNKESSVTAVSKNLVLDTALVTIASGADNIGVYIPLFATFSLWQMAIVFAVFAVMTALWCLLSASVTKMPFIRNFLTRYRYIIVPAVYIGLGVYIIFR